MNKREILARLILILALAVLIYLTISSFRITPHAVLSSNLEITIPADYKSITPGSELWFETKLLNLADLGKRDVTLSYEILDTNLQHITSKTETVAVQTQASFVSSLQLPMDVTPGNYFLKLTLNDKTNQQTIESQTTFTIHEEEKPKTMPYLNYIPIALAALAVILILVYQGNILLKKARLRAKIRRIIKKKLSQ